MASKKIFDPGLKITGQKAFSSELLLNEIIKYKKYMDAYGMSAAKQAKEIDVDAANYAVDILKGKAFLGILGPDIYPPTSLSSSALNDLIPKTKEQKLANVYKTSSELAQSISETLQNAGVSLEVAIAALMQLLVAGAFEFQKITKQDDAFEKMIDDMRKMITALAKPKKEK